MKNAFLLPLAIVFFGLICSASERVECIADTQICQFPAETEFNCGQRTQIRIKGNEAYMILKFDLSKLQGKQASGGRLFLANASDKPVKIDMVSTIAIDWAEGTGNWEKNVKGGANFLYAVYDTKKWADGGDFLSVVFGKGGSISNSKVGVIPAKGQGVIELDGPVVQALIDGKQFGIALGSTARENVDVYSREQNSSKPMLEVLFGGEKRAKSWTAYDPPKVNENDWANPVKCADIADTNILSSGDEQLQNCGGLPRLKLKGIEDQILVKFDVEKLKGMTIDKARIYLRKTEQCKLITLGISTIAADWEEGTASYAKEVGSPCFQFRKLPADTNKPAPDDWWAGPNSKFQDVAQGEGNTISCYSNVFAGENPDWICVDVAPAVAQDLIAHKQYGLIISEEKGQRAFADYMKDDTANTNENPNHFVFSRNQGPDFAPYLVVSCKVADTTAPAPITDVKSENTDHGRRMEPGQVKLIWTAAGTVQAFAYDVRYSSQQLDANALQAAQELPRFQVIRPGKPGSQEVMWLDILEPGTTYNFAVRAVDKAGQTSPPVFCSATATAAETTAITPAPAPKVATGGPATGGGLTVWAFPDVNKVSPVTGGMLEDDTYLTGPSPARNGNLVWDGAAKTIRIAGCSNEFVGFQLAIESDTPNAPRDVAVSLDAVGPITGKDIRFYREWCVSVKDKQGNKTFYPDPLLPLEDKLAIPNADTGKPATSNVIPGQKLGLVFADLYIPHKTAPGTYTGQLKVDALTIPVELTVYNFELPDTTDAIIFELNNYSGWNGEYGKQTPEKLAELEWNYHRVAHEHRLNFNSVNHGHRLSLSPGVTPVITGSGKNMHVSDWTAWDARYGPLLDGSAFKDLPRAGVPITEIYLPFVENWPSDFIKHFHYDIAKDMVGTFDQEYIDEISSVVGDFMKHFNEKGWTKTEFQFFLNSKNYYFKPWQSPEGTYWLLDEPMHRDDYLALNFYGNVWREAARASKGNVNAGFRADVSRPEWQRDYLDKTLDVFCGGYSEGFFKIHVDRQCRRHDESFNGPRQVWTYGGANGQNEPNLAMPAWIVKSYLLGIKGMLPWLTEGDNWQDAEATCVLYCGNRFGQFGPYTSLRLKAMRRGQQDAEYLNLLEKAKGCLRSTTKREVGKFMNLTSKLVRAFAEDAGKETFSALDASSFERLRRTVADELSKTPAR
jgi:hypothetical protein